MVYANIMRLGGIVWMRIQMLDYLDVHNHNHNNNNIIVYGNRATIQTPSHKHTTHIRLYTGNNACAWCSRHAIQANAAFYCAKSCVHETPPRH